MEMGFTTAVYVVAAILFILSLGGLVGPRKRQTGRLAWHCWHGAGGDRHIVRTRFWCVVAVFGSDRGRRGDRPSIGVKS